MAKVTTELYGDLALLPIEATVPCTETLEWKTEVIVHYDGSEKREQLIANPRQSFSYRISETLRNKISAYLVEYGALSLDWFVPVWIEQHLLGATTRGATSITLADISIYDFRSNSLAFLYESPVKWQVLEIDTVDLYTNTMTLTTPLELFANAKLMPARVGIIKKSITKNSNGHSAISSIKFDIKDNTTLPPYAPQQEFLGEDMHTDAPLMKSTHKQQLTTRVDNVDFGLGIFDTVTPWINNRVVRASMATMQGAEEIRIFKSFLARRIGKLRVFWEPTFESDLVLRQNGFLTNSIIVEAAGFNDWDKQRKHIVIQDTVGNWKPLTIESVIKQGGETFELQVSPDIEYHSSEISMISFLGLKRLDTDRVEIKWIGNNTIKTSINVIEVSP